MVQKILQEIKKNHGVVVLKELAAKLDMEPGALEGILQTMNKSKIVAKKTAMPMCSRRTCAGCPFMGSPSNEVCGYRTVMELSLRK
ncbi:MAG TPA: hypothetical protein DCK95_11655 [Anaerolineaceae bacterium]|nr:hypothetical protein [Anaerolineaceae bacterium]